MGKARIGVFLCLIAAAAVGFAWNGDTARRIRAHHVGKTVIVSAGNRRLRSVFDGLPVDQRFNAKTALELTRNQQRCSARRPAVGGTVGKLLSLVESSVYAQGTCTPTSCAGNFWSQQSGGTLCTTPNCSGYYASVVVDYNQWCQGNRVKGTQGCIGSGCTATSCDVYVCNNGASGCGGGGGGCINGGQECDPDNDQCCPPYSCDEGDGLCEDTELRRRAN
jgi:hypothetical protein